MPLQTANILYPVNTTTVDTAAGIDVRLLASAAGSADASQTATFTNSNSNVERTFDPATAAGATVANAASFQGEGWALRLAEDMTPANDTDFDAALSTGTLTVGMLVNATQSGGTYASGTLTPTFRASLWKYNLATNTGTLIASGTTTGTSWSVATAGGDLGTAKVATISINISTLAVFGAIKGSAAEVLFLQLGFNTGTVPAPTLGTATFTMTLTVGSTSTNIDFAANQGISEVGYMVGSSAGVATVAGVGTPVYPTTGSSAGAATVAGVLEADLVTSGTAAGAATVSGSFGAVKVGTGTSNGVGAASAAASIVKPTVGTVNVSEGGGTTTVVRRSTVIFDD